jgi:hypothetical protein
MITRFRTHLNNPALMLLLVQGLFLLAGAALALLVPLQ